MKNITYRSDVVKTPAITRCVELIDPYFDGLPSEVTSGLRTTKKQLQIIIEKAKRHGIDKDFEEFVNNIGKEPEFALFVDGIVPAVCWWQRTWSKLLSIGDIVNPPIPAECLFDYYRPGSKENKKGQIISLSPHQHGLAFDIGGDSNLIERAKRVMRAKQENSCFLSNFLVEHVNNAIHCDVEQIG